MVKLGVDVLETLDLLTWTKDLKFRYSSCSENVADVAGMDSSKNVLGKTDFDFVWRDMGSFDVAGNDL